MPKQSLQYPQPLTDYVVSLQGIRPGAHWPEILQWVGGLSALSDEQARSMMIDRWANLEHPRPGYNNVQLVLGNI